MGKNDYITNYSPFRISVGYKQILYIYDNTGNLILMAGDTKIILQVVANTKYPLKYKFWYEGNEQATTSEIDRHRPQYH